MQHSQIQSQPKGILPQFSTSQVRCQFGAKFFTCFNFKNYFHLCHHMKEKNVSLPSWDSTALQQIAKTCLDGSLSLWPQTPSSLRTEPLLRARNRVLSDLHDYLNAGNNSRYYYYPQKRKLKFKDVWGKKQTNKKNMPEAMLKEGGDSSVVGRNLLGKYIRP